MVYLHIFGSYLPVLVGLCISVSSGSLGIDEELLHPELLQYFLDVWQVFLQDFVDK